MVDIHTLHFFYELSHSTILVQLQVQAYNRPALANHTSIEGPFCGAAGPCAREGS